MTRPTAPRGEHAGRPGTRWETRLVAVERVVEDGEPAPRANRAARRAAKKASEPTSHTRSGPDSDAIAEKAPVRPVGPRTPALGTRFTSETPRGPQRSIYGVRTRGADDAPPPQPARILITGSRDWPDAHLVHRELARCWRDFGSVVVVHGACPSGADAHAARWVADMVAAGVAGITEEPHPARWDVHGTVAGPIRNRLMVGLGAATCLAFIRNGSAGASHTARLAETAGIDTRRWTA